MLTCKVHDICCDDVLYIDENNQHVNMTWSDFLQSRIDTVKTKAVLDDKTVQAIEQKLEPLLQITVESPSLLHGDLHSNNVLLRGDELVLFDQGYRVRTGDPLYDLAIVFIGFPSGRYVEVDDENYKNDTSLLAAFCEGYGAEFIRNNQNTLDLYVLMRAFERYPNLYEPYLKEIIIHIL